MKSYNKEFYHIQIVSIPSLITSEAVQEMLPRVSEQRRAQALQFKHAFGQYACLKSYLMLQDLLREHYGIEGDLLFTYNEYGKPDLYTNAANRIDDKLKPYFSISHCKQAIAVAVADTPIGIDIETLRHPSESLIEKTMNEQERHQIAAAESPDNMFTALWTRKEAVLKCKGTGIIDDLHSVLTPTHIGEDYQIETVNDHLIYSICVKKSN
ncbi:MAG: 4'-phosphopantetheinyl transferase superfamily protein [Paludibacteraceae bacterium]|nr:4'-phosphopantetheinyl transferase superfamily protein [Paludibacteraceae bacterium]